MSNFSSKNSGSPSPDREFSVILEDLRSQFRVFGEGLIGLTEKVEKMDTRLDRIDTRLERVEMILPTLATKAEVAKMIASATTPLATKAEFYQLFNVLSDHETRMTTLEK